MTVKATRGAQTDNFRYGPDGARTRSWGSDGARVYLPGYEHRTDTGETKVYVGDYAVISRTGATRKVDYLLKDRLGSVDAVTDSAGSVTETRGYDAFGKPRSGTWNDLTPPKLGSVAITPKGFTQHEHLNQLELIHMNGRVFDYALGRFFSVDPVIQFPLNSQSLNPYSYILNNPLSGTDPTGYACSTGTNIKTEGGPDCESLGVMNGPADQYPVAQSNRSMTIRDGDGSRKTVNMTVTRNSDGTNSYTQNGGVGTVPPRNGADHGSGTESKNVSDDVDGHYADLKAKRDRMKGAVNGVKAGFDRLHDGLDPCMGATTTTGCALVVAGTGLVIPVARVVGGVVRAEVNGLRVFGDARGVAHEVNGLRAADGSGFGAQAGGGARLENISDGDYLRIQNAVNRTGIEVTVVGSRARGAGAASDWDYVVPVDTPRKDIKSLKSSLPEGPRGLGEPRRQDFFREKVNESSPYIRFTPQKVLP